MASRRFFLRRDILPIAAGALAAGTVFLPKTAHADAPTPLAPTTTTTSAIPSSKKPIYDDTEPATPISTSTSNSTTTPTLANPSEPAGYLATKPSADSTSPSTSTTASTSPTPTDRLETYIRSARLGLYHGATTSEATVNNLMTRALRLEHSFTSTLASLAPPKTANEPLVPGLVYVLVSTMAGSIVSRNRGVLLRLSVPLAFGVGAGYVVLPVTMRNVGDLVWRYEERYPVVADTHLRVRERVERFWETGKAHAGMGVHMVGDKVEEAKEAVQGWVKQGK